MEAEDSTNSRREEKQLILRHSGVPDDEMGRQLSEGWTLVLSMPAERFGAGSVAPASN
jgi:hypothetical protein